MPCCLAIFLSFPTGTEFGLSVRETEYHTTGPEVCELGLDCGKEPAVGAADKCAPPCELICTLPPSLRAARVEVVDPSLSKLVLPLIRLSILSGPM